MKNNYINYNLINLVNIGLLLIVICLIYKIITINSKELYEDNKIIEETIEEEDSKTIPEDSGNCNTQSDIVDFCINYNSCCSTNSTTKECLCNHPFVKNCRTNFTNCLNNNHKQLNKNDLMNSCINENKTCCSEYNNNLSINSNAFNDPIKNNPVIKPLCSINNIPDIEQKCLELCTTTPKCVAYSLNTGVLVPDYGTCSLYDNVSFAISKINKTTGNPIPFTNNYYTRK